MEDFFVAVGGAAALAEQTDCAGAARFGGVGGRISEVGRRAVVVGILRAWFIGRLSVGRTVCAAVVVWNYFWSVADW